MERGAHGNLAMLCNSCSSGGGEVKREPEYWWEFENTGNILVQSMKNGCVKVCETIEEAEEFILALANGRVRLDSKGGVKS